MLDPKEFITMKDWISKRLRDWSKHEWICVYEYIDFRQSPNDSSWIFPILVPISESEDIELGHDARLDISGVILPFPGFEEVDDQWVYQRYSWNGGIEPLVLLRSFERPRDGYIELVEEFRLFHNLYPRTHEPSMYVKHADGQEHEVARVEGRKVLIHRKYLLQYMAAKQYDLVLLFDIDRHASMELSEIPEEMRYITHSDSLLHYTLDVGIHPIGEHNVGGLLHGRLRIECPPQEKCGIWPYEQPRKYEEFIIGVDELGDPVVYTCDPNLVDYQTEPHFQTTVYFKKTLLDKYRTNSDMYRVSDGNIQGVGSWGIRADTNHKEYIIAFLGDLGRSLPYHEQQHWKTYNIVAPVDPTLSVTHAQRLIGGEWVNPEDIVFRFKGVFKRLQKQWKQKFGWQLFLDLHTHDIHHWHKLQSPSRSDDLSQFEDIITALNKILVEAVNVEEIKKVVAPQKDEKGLKLLQRYLIHLGLNDAEQKIAVMHQIYRIRNKSAGHRKGSDYDELAAKMGFESRGYIDIVNELLRDTVAFIEYLITAASDEI